MNPYEKLCIHDERSPYFNPPVDTEDFIREARYNCACDNCFYGRDAMALEILRLREALEVIEGVSMDCGCDCHPYARATLNTGSN